jgi:purine-binding chemotaxis protein CheW
MMQTHSEIEFVTVFIGEQLFGLPIDRVHDVFKVDRLTRVPLAAPEIAGVLNLRGRIVTAIDMRLRLDLPSLQNGEHHMAIGIEHRGESYGLIVDQVGEVIKIPVEQRDANPVNLDPRWGRIAAGVFQLEESLMVILDVDRILDIQSPGLAA